jgi:hypothetical protein
VLIHPVAGHAQSPRDLGRIDPPRRAARRRKDPLGLEHLDDALGERIDKLRDELVDDRGIDM